MSATPVSASEISWDLEPVERIDLAALLVDTFVFIRRFVVLSDAQAVAATLWVAHTHAIDAADCTPYLRLTSATPRCGKTRALEVLEPLVARPWLTGRTSAAALVRKMDSDRPTLLLDETDAAFAGSQEYAEAVRGVLNSGYRRSGRATLCFGQGSGIKVVDLATFGPKALAGIGKVPSTVADRSIPIVLRRRTRAEPVERWRERDGHQQAAPIRTALADWSKPVIPALRDARPEIPAALGDRASDCWEPLFCIADAAGGDWPQRAREAAVALTGQEPDDDGVAIQLLADLRDVFGDADALPSHTIITHLTARDDRPWATWSKGKPITGHALARLLKPFGVLPAGTIHIDDKSERGYRRASFLDAWTRYLPGRDEPTAEPSAPAQTSLLPEEPATEFRFDPAQAFGGSDEEIEL